MKTNTKYFLLYWIVVAILFIFMALACQKAPDVVPQGNCDCGIVLSNTNDGTRWTTVVQNNCTGIKDTTIWNFPMDDCWQPGSEICKLPEIEIPLKP